jgi:hypothetical protein
VDKLKSNDKIGSVDISIRDLQDMKEHVVECRLSKEANRVEIRARQASVETTGAPTPPCKVVVRIVPIPSQPEQLKKTVFFIRHGESKWNQAQDSKNLVDMVKETDHGLSDEGKNQARHLASCTKSADFASDPDSKKFMQAQKIYISPLTRQVLCWILLHDSMISSQRN